MDLIFEDKEDVAVRYPTIIREGETIVAEVFCNALYNDKGAWVFAKASPLHDQAGNIIGAIESIRDITEHKLAGEKIKGSLLEKETMLKEIHHRVKNNMQVISSLLDLQAAKLPDEKSREIFQDSINRVSTMASIHNQLYQSEDLTWVDFGGFIRDLVGNLRQSYGRSESPVAIEVETSDMHLGIESSVPCGLIVNELVSNALKHAFPGGRDGEIDVGMRSEKDLIVLTVRDNGIGFPESIDHTEAKSLGLELVNILVGQIGGKIDIQVDGGTTWTITFPVKNERKWRNG
jgi:two-component sensor histidine kinase